MHVLFTRVQHTAPVSRASVCKHACTRRTAVGLVCLTCILVVMQPHAWVHVYRSFSHIYLGSHVDVNPGTLVGGRQVCLYNYVYVCACMYALCVKAHICMCIFRRMHMHARTHIHTHLY